MSLLGAGAAAIGITTRDAEHVQSGGRVRLSAESVDRMAAQAEAATVLAGAALAEIDAARDSLSPVEQRLAKDTHEVLTRIAQASGSHDRSSASAQFSGPETRGLANLVVEHLDRIEAARPHAFGPMDEHERFAATVSCVSKVLLRNESDGTVGRLAGNAVAVGLRTGSGTFVGTFARNMAGFHLQQSLNAIRAANDGTLPEATARMLHIGGGVLLAIPAALHLAGTIRDAVNGQGTRESYNGRVAQAAVSWALTGYAAATGNFEAVSAFNTAVLVYSVGRALSAIALRNDSNQGAQSGGALAVSTVAYANAQAAGSLLQDHANWNASVSDPRIKLTDSAGTSRTPAQINSVEHSYAGNAGHSTLNAALEMFDDLQTGAIARFVNTGQNRKRWKEFSPEKQAQSVAAGMHAYVGASRAGQGLSQAGLESAFVEGMHNFQKSELEGLRMSLSRTPPTQKAVLERAQRSADELAALGYTPTRHAAAGSTEEQTNRIVAAYVAQSITALHRQQPLAAPLGGSWRELGTRTANQLLNVEAQRQNIFHSIYAGLYAAPSLPTDPTRNPTIDSAVGAAELGGIVATMYPTFVGALTGRGPANADTASERALQAQVDAIAQSPGRPEDLKRDGATQQAVELTEVRVERPANDLVDDRNVPQTIL